MSAAQHLIVYVEDNEDNFRLIQRLLESTGRYRVLHAPDGPSGLEMIREELPVIALLDLDLPGITGFELARLLRASPETQRIKLVAISANVMQREHQRALEAGCEFFVEKPVNIVGLRNLIAKLVKS
ncbi:MAG: response regulator [Deltaproteobacteria bacterium]|nr:response regulator [Deltaproteobacteria bacterium]